MSNFPSCWSSSWRRSTTVVRVAEHPSDELRLRLANVCRVRVHDRSDGRFDAVFGHAQLRETSGCADAAGKVVQGEDRVLAEHVCEARVRLGNGGLVVTQRMREYDRVHPAMVEPEHPAEDVTGLVVQRGPGDGERTCREIGAVERPVSYTHLRAHETDSYLVCRLLL